MGNRRTPWCGKGVFVRCATGGGDVIVLWLSHRKAPPCLNGSNGPIRSRHAADGDDSVINVTVTDELSPSHIVRSRLMAILSAVTPPDRGRGAIGGTRERRANG